MYLNAQPASLKPREPRAAKAAIIKASTIPKSGMNLKQPLRVAEVIEMKAKYRRSLKVKRIATNVVIPRKKTKYVSHIRVSSNKMIEPEKRGKH